MFDMKPSCDYEYITPAAFVVDRRRQTNQTSDYEEITAVSDKVEHRRPCYRPFGTRCDVVDNRRSELPLLTCVTTAVRYRKVSNDYEDTPLPPATSEPDNPPPPIPSRIRPDDRPPPIPDRLPLYKHQPCQGDIWTSPSDDLSPPSLPPKSPASRSFRSIRRLPPAVPPEVENGGSDSAYQRTVVPDKTERGDSHAYETLRFD